MLSLVSELPAQPQALYQRSVPFDILSPHILQKPLAATDQAEQPSPGGVVRGMQSQVRRQVPDPRGEDRNLHLRRTGVGLASAIVRDDLGFCCGIERHRTLTEAWGLY
jgi:hypothetical protein